MNGLRVNFYPVNPSDKAPDHVTAVTRQDGTFSLSTYDPDDGAPAGEYQVTVTLIPGEGRRKKEKPDLLHGRYGNPKTSGLTAKVEEKSNELPPFNLATQ